MSNQVPLEIPPERLVPTCSPVQYRTLVSFVQTPEHSGQWGLSRDSILIPAGQVAWVKCRVPSKMDQYSTGTVALFEPDEDNVQLEQLDMGEGLLKLPSSGNPYGAVPIGNHSTCNITLSRNTILRYSHPVETVLEVDKRRETKDIGKVQSASVAVVDESSTLWHPPVDLSHLSEDQQAVVKQMLHEESASFARDGNDVGCFPSLQMSINLKDDIPVQRSYSSPKPFQRSQGLYPSPSS